MKLPQDGKVPKASEKAATPAETDGSGLVCRPGFQGRVWQEEGLEGGCPE